MNVDERVSKVERRVSTVEEAIQLLSKLIASHDDGLFDSLKKDEDMSEKITMLIDAQIRNEDKWQKNNEEFNAKIVVLAKTQTKNIKELNAEIAVLVNAQIRSEDKIQDINSALDKLTKLVKNSYSRIDRLEK